MVQASQTAKHPAQFHTAKLDAAVGTPAVRAGHKSIMWYVFIKGSSRIKKDRSPVTKANKINGSAKYAAHVLNSAQLKWPYRLTSWSSSTVLFSCCPINNENKVDTKLHKTIAGKEKIVS